MKYIFSFVLAVVTVMLIVNIVSEGVMTDGAAIVSQVSGTATIFTTEAPAGRLIKNNDALAKSGRVEVKGASRLELRLPDGGFLRLSDNARLTMRLVQFEKRTGTMNVQAFLHNGKLWAKIKKVAAPGSSVEIITGTGLVTAKDAVYAVNAEENAGTTVNVYEGAVLAAGKPKEAAQSASQTNTAADGEPVNVQTFQQLSLTAQAIVPPSTFDLKAAIDDWIRWNLQRDAREGLVSITLAPASSTVTRGRSLQFAAVAHYPEKTEKDISSFATWSSSPVSIANIDASGLAAGTALGTATISAAIEDMSGSTTLSVSRDVISIKVTPASKSLVNGGVQQFTAIGTFSDRTVKDITSSALWRSSNTTVAFIDASGRAVAGNSAGTAVISASLGAKQGSATIKVRRELISITIMPESALIMSGETQRFGAVGRYSDGTTQDLTETVEWESSDPGIAEVDQAQAGRAIGKNRPGKATIKASFNNKSGSASITINTIDTLAAP